MPPDPPPPRRPTPSRALQSPVAEPITINFDQPVSIFPLPGCVLLPFGLMPLHIFEDRYRQMIRDALDSNGLIAMGLFQGPVSEHDYYHDKPTLRPNICVGYIQKYELTDDGRYYILLQGILRARIIREIDHQPYRKVMLEPVEYPPRTDDQLRHARQQIADQLSCDSLDKSEPIQQARALLDQPFPTTGLIDLMIQALTEDPDRRYAMLVETDPQSRADWLVAHINAMRNNNTDPPVK